VKMAYIVWYISPFDSNAKRHTSFLFMCIR
jgi:protein subunit release factor B